MSSLFLVAVWSALAQAGGVPKATRSHWMTVTPAERDAEMGQLAGEALPARLLRLSAGFLNTPYLHSPLGEGSGVDPDPPLRFDAVDCLTFVETTLAMSLAPNAAELPSLLERIRYQKLPTYEDRNHLMEAQWLPHNRERGFLVDVTERYGGDAVRTVEHVLTPGSWRSGSSRELHLSPDRQVTGRFRLNIVPLNQAMAILRQVPDGTLVLVVREERPWKVTRVTHLGFLVHQGAQVRLRHASKAPFARVVDEDLGSFLARNARYEKWPVSGLSLFQVQRPPAGAPE